MKFESKETKAKKEQENKLIQEIEPGQEKPEQEEVPQEIQIEFDQSGAQKDKKDEEKIENE